MSVLFAALIMLAPAFAADEPLGHYFKDGIRYVDGKPYFVRAAFFGYNHWMTMDETKSLGNFMSIPFEQVGTHNDFYSTAGFNTGYYSTWLHHWSVDTPYDPELTLESFRRAKKAGQKVVVHLPVFAPASITDEMDLHWVTEEGEKLPLSSLWGIHHDPEKNAEAVRRAYKPMFDAVRDEPLLIGYQLGGERWAYDSVRAKKEVSYDDYTLNKFREFLQGSFSLEEISQRYGGSPDFYASWEEVFPPISKRPLDFKKRELSNFNVARWDWHRFRELHGVKVWVKMIETFQEMDGRGRPFSFEHGHGPYAAMGWHPFPEIVAETKNFSVGDGFFEGDLTGYLSQVIMVKGCGEGPWTNNELDAGTGGRYVNAADMRRTLWASVGLGSAGYHVWTFFNLMGAQSEFMNNTLYDPKLYENMPPKFFEILHSNKMLESMGETLPASKSAPTRIALMTLDDSLFNYTYTFDYRPEAKNLCRALVTRGLADDLALYTKYHLDNTPMEGLKAIVLPRMPRLTDGRAKKLAEFVERGGTLILMGPTGRYNELFEEQKVFPYGVLGQAAGIEMRTLKPEEVVAAGTLAQWNGQDIHIDTQVDISIPEGSKAKAIAKSPDGRIVATVNSFGKGRVYSLSGYPLVTNESDTTGDFIAALLSEGGAPAAVRVESGGKPSTSIFTSRRIGPDGALVFLVENDNQSHKDLKVVLDPELIGLNKAKNYSAFELFSDEAHQMSASGGFQFTTELEPVGVRVFLVTEAKSLDELIPANQRYLVPRTPEEPLVTMEQLKASRWGKDYLTSTALRETLTYWRGRTLNARELGAGEPEALGEGYYGLDLGPVAMSPLSKMVKSLDDTQFVNFGSVEAATDSGAALGFKDGKNTLGGVPFWSDGRYLAMPNRYRVTDIPVNKAVSGLTFFQTAQQGADDSTLGDYTVRYEDGTQVQIPIVLGVTVQDATRPVRFPTKTHPVTTVKDKNNRSINLSRYEWKNPFPDKKVESVDVTTIETGDSRTLDIWAITAKES